MSFDQTNVVPGFYILSRGADFDACVVKVYMYEGVLMVGYGVWDGAGLIPVRDLCGDCAFNPVAIVPCYNLAFEPR